MAKAKFDIPTQIPAGATRPLYAGVGMTDLVVGVFRDYVADVQKRVVTVQKSMSTKDAAASRRAIEKRVAELQSEALTLPVRMQKMVDEQVSTAGDTYADLVKRGETLVGRIRRQQSTRATVSSAKTTTAKAKTTRTQASKTASSTTTAAKKTAKKTATKAKKSPARSSAKATGTAAKKTATAAAQATTDASAKVGS